MGFPTFFPVCVSLPYAESRTIWRPKRCSNNSMSGKIDTISYKQTSNDGTEHKKRMFAYMSSFTSIKNEIQIHNFLFPSISLLFSLSHQMQLFYYDDVFSVSSRSVWKCTRDASRLSFRHHFTLCRWQSNGLVYIERSFVSLYTQRHISPGCMHLAVEYFASQHAIVSEPHRIPFKSTDCSVCASTSTTENRRCFLLDYYLQRSYRATTLRSSFPHLMCIRLHSNLIYQFTVLNLMLKTPHFITSRNAVAPPLPHSTCWSLLFGKSSQCCSSFDFSLRQLSFVLGETNFMRIKIYRLSSTTSKLQRWPD